MTRSGRILEKTKLDELPQFWNVLKGDMSFCGPRPESLRFQQLFTGEYTQLFDFKPGIFGPNQLIFRNEGSLYPLDQDPESYYCEHLFPEKAQRDLDFFKKRNIFSELYCIAAGLFVTIFLAVDLKKILHVHSPIFLADIVALSLAWGLANVIRFEGPPHAVLNKLDRIFFFEGFYILLPPIILLFILFGVYRTPPSHFDLTTGISISKRVFTAMSFTTFGIMLLHYRLMSLFVLTLFFVISLTLMFGLRIIARIHWENKRCKNHKNIETCSTILIYGAGQLGKDLAYWISLRLKGVKLHGYLDDNRSLHGRTVAALPILGGARDIPTLCQLHNIKEIWLTFVPRSDQLQKIHSICNEHEIKIVSILEQEPYVRFI